MSIFKKDPPQFRFETEKIKSPIPLLHLDIEKRYDVYCFVPREERLYENVKLISVRTLDDINPTFTAISGLVEIETSDGTRMMIRKFDIYAVCEHGTKVKYTVLRSWTSPDDDRGTQIGL